MKKTMLISLISMVIVGMSCSDKEQKSDFPQAWGELTSIRCVGQDTTTMHYLRADGTVDSTTVVRYLMEDDRPSYGKLRSSIYVQHTDQQEDTFFPSSWGKLLGFSWRPVWDKLEKPTVPVELELIPHTNWKPVNGWGRPRWENGVMSADWCEDGQVVNTYSVEPTIRPLTHWEPVL